MTKSTKSKTAKVTSKNINSAHVDMANMKSEIDYLRGELRRLGDALTSIQTTQSRKLLYDGLTLDKAKQIGINIEATISYAFGDMTLAELKKTFKTVPVKA